MIIRVCFSVVLLFLVAQHGYAQTYVNITATGANDGSSWTDAYTDLSSAIAASSPGDQLWIAAGTYLPGGGRAIRDTFFQPQHDLELYGGFSGTETQIEDRNLEEHQTILSGDHNGDDIDSDFINNKTDNALHVMFLGEDITAATILDGLTIAYGQTDDASSSGNRRRGGGLLTYGSPTIRNCIFRQNYGWFGGGLYPRSGTEAIELSHCRFEENAAGFGAGMYINHWQSTISSCQFENNRASGSGGGLYNTSETCQMTDCTFYQNVAEENRGGGLFLSGSKAMVMNCDFSNNIAGSSSGGNIHVAHPSGELSVKSQFTSCIITDGTATWGGGISAYDLGTEVTFTSCEIRNNMSFNQGGGLHAGREAIVEVIDCDLSGNSTGSGGAINSQNDSTIVRVTRSRLINNIASNNGGAINMFSDNEVGAMSPLLVVESSTIAFNSCSSQGGGINLLNADMEMHNTTVSNNTNFSLDGAGGGISINGFDAIDVTATIINSTLYGNSAALGAGIGHFTDSIGTSVLNLGNTIIFGSEGSSYEVEAGLPEVLSLGGNHIDDSSLVFDLMAENDDNLSLPMLENPALGLFSPLEGSPCIDRGISTIASALDIDGNPRIGPADKGAYEYQGMATSVLDINASLDQILIQPNPVQEMLIVTLANVWSGLVSFSILDMQGQLRYTHSIQKTADDMLVQTDVSHLPEGTYILSFQNSAHRLVKAFVKVN